MQDEEIGPKLPPNPEVSENDTESPLGDIVKIVKGLMRDILKENP